MKSMATPLATLDCEGAAPGAKSAAAAAASTGERYDRYDRFTAWLHWGIGILLLAEIAFGFVLD